MAWQFWLNLFPEWQHGPCSAVIACRGQALCSRKDLTLQRARAAEWQSEGGDTILEVKPSVPPDSLWYMSGLDTLHRPLWAQHCKVLWFMYGMCYCLGCYCSRYTGVSWAGGRPQRPSWLQHISSTRHLLEPLPGGDCPDIQQATLPLLTGSSLATSTSHSKTPLSHQTKNGRFQNIPHN